jgi:hypothetical protein
MPLDILVLTLLGVIIVSMVDAAYFKENCSSGLAVLNLEGVYADDPDILFGGILIGVYIV